MQQLLTLRAAIGDTGPCGPIWQGLDHTDRVALEPVRVDPLPRAFRRMVRDLEFDVSEMPVVTFAQAMLAGVPLMLLPIPASRRFHHASILCREDSDIRSPGDLAGKRVAARSWPQTSGVWLRGILMHDYGLPLDRVNWLVQEGPHVEGWRDPDFVELDHSGRKLVDLLLDGRVDAVTGLHGIPDGTRLLMPDAAEAAAQWHERTGIFPINHAIAVRRDLVERHPWLPGELMALFGRATQAMPGPAARRPTPGQPALGLDWQIGFGPNQAAMQMLLDFATEQGILPRPVDVTEIFDPAVMGAEIPVS